MSLATQPVLFVDCQTTGANPAAGSLLELSWFIADAQQQFSELQSFLLKQPDEKQVPYRIKALTGITDADMQDAHDLEDVQQLFHDSLRLLPAPPVCVAHFARFEHPFLHNLLCPNEEAELPFDLLCTYEIARRLFPNLPSKGLRAVAGYFGTTCGELKRARCHVEATWSIWQGLVERLGKTSISSVAELKTWLEVESAPKRTRFEYPLAKEKRLSLPDRPGVYRMISKTGIILYVGKATSLRDRVNSYFRGQKGKDSKTKELLSQVWDLDVSPCSTPLQAALLEADEIKKWDPPYNRVLKRRQRELVFYSPDFSKASTLQDAEHPLGPFPSLQILQPLIKLMESLSTKSFAPDIFYYDVPKSLLNDGFQLFCINEGLEAADLSSPRSLLAVGLWLHRRRMIEDRAEKLIQEARQNGLDALEDVAEDQVGQTLDDESAASEISKGMADTLSPQDVALKYERLLRHVARVYLRSKSLTNLLHTEVNYTHKGVEHSLRVVNGSVHDRVSLDATHKAEQPRMPWKDLDISTYDRMSVLLTELSRVGAQAALSNS